MSDGKTYGYKTATKKMFSMTDVLSFYMRDEDTVTIYLDPRFIIKGKITHVEEDFIEMTDDFAVKNKECLIPTNKIKYVRRIQ